MNNLKLNPYEILIQLSLFFGLAVFPLFPELNWITTVLILPAVGSYLLIITKIGVLLKNNLIKGMFLFSIISILSIFNIINFSYYLNEIIGILGVFTMLIISYLLTIRNKNNIWYLYIILVLKYILMIIYTHKNGLTLDINPNTGRLNSGENVGINSNTYGYFSFIAIFALSIIYNTFRTKKILILLILTIISSFYINIITASRAGLIFSVLASISILISLRSKTFKSLIIRLILSIAIFYFFISYYDFNNISDYTIIKRFVNFAEAKEDSRIRIFNDGLSIFLKNPFGVGAGHFPLYVYGVTAHNGFLLIAVNYGLINVLVYLSLFYFSIRKSIKLINKSSLDNKKAGFAFFSFLVLFFLYHFFYDMYINLYIMLMFFLINFHIEILSQSKSLSISK